MDMKTYLLNYIKENPGTRKREIPKWSANRSAMILALDELEKEHKIRSVTYSDPAQMEFYDKYYAVGAVVEA